MKYTDVLIVGGGPAGLTAAMVLARGGRSVLVFDEGKPRNASASHMMNFPSRDGTPPEEFKRLIREDLKKYKEVSYDFSRVNSVVKNEEGFLVNETVQATKILLAHGVRDLVETIPGLKERWGKSVFHCPYCHGHEHKGEPMGLIAEGPAAEHMSIILKGLTKDLIIFNPADIEGFTTDGVKLKTGEVVKRSCFFYKAEQQLSCDLNLGCELNEFGHYKVDENFQTTVSGVYAAGDIVTLRQSVLNACSSAQLAAAMMNFELLK